MTEQLSGTGNCASGAEAVIEKYSLTVYRLAFARTRSKEAAEEIYQEVFLRYIRKTPRFESEEHAKAWFLRVTVNCAKGFARTLARHRAEPIPEQLAAPQDPCGELTEYLAWLKPEYRTVIHLFYYEDYTTARIAALLREKESTVRMQLTRARRQLKTLIEGTECKG